MDTTTAADTQLQEARITFNILLFQEKGAKKAFKQSNKKANRNVSLSRLDEEDKAAEGRDNNCHVDLSPSVLS
jgi:hypothetical protein